MIADMGYIPEDPTPLLYVSVYTESYREKAERLRQSLAKHGLPHALFLIPAIHCSVTPSGSQELRYSKPALIAKLLTSLKRPLVYLDCDLVVEQGPILFDELKRDAVDFAILNWAMLEVTDGWLPVPLEERRKLQAESRNLYAFGVATEWHSDSQLICSGAVQFWRPTPMTLHLLQRWQETIRRFPGVVDDVCLDYTFNNASAAERRGLRPAWLPKTYCRYPWWLFDQPVINHPQLPYNGEAWKKLTAADGTLRFYPDQGSRRIVSSELQRYLRECLIDIDRRELYRLEKDNQWVLVARFQGPLWP